MRSLVEITGWLFLRVNVARKKIISSGYYLLAFDYGNISHHF